MASESTSCLSTAISETFDHKSITILVFLTLVLLGLISRYLLLRFPCFTLASLNGAETHLEEVFDDAVKNDSLYGADLENFTLSKLRLKKRASELRSRGLQIRHRFWNINLGLHLELVLDIVEWYAEVEVLQRDIQALVEHDNQHRCDAELHRRENTASRTPPSATTIATPGASPPLATSAILRTQTRHRFRRPGALISTSFMVEG
ncbi:40S ribosomal protein S6 [Paramarasmius palmivorus]|uniref:40S ribosomal protein S6 n=1 Tax=Paramarasmius palmivorus TaxID=297713 RepID=A0AAW0CRJ3_9AGAR